MGIEELELWIQAIVILFSQLAFIYFRTLNVYYNSRLDRFGVFWTGIFIHLFWLICIAIGSTALIKGNYWLVAFSLSGGLYGADWALRRKINQNKKGEG